MPPRKKQPSPQNQLMLDGLLPPPDAIDVIEGLPSDEPERSWLTVTELTDQILRCFSRDPVLGKTLTIKAELSNVKTSSRGHVYLTLKDEQSSVSSVIWASMARSLRFELQDGLEVFATGKLDVYAPNGTYSLIIQKLEPVGVGALQLAFEQLKNKLAAEGLFNPEYKKSIPAFAKRVGMVTSATGAVVHDMLRVIRRKNDQTHVVLAPVKVQGEGAVQEIADAIAMLNDPTLALDTIIVGRGGGSFEDLFCFSEEPVVRAIFNSRVPVITGIGHEPDFGLADAVADFSASTPTAAAEAAVFDLEAWQGDIEYRAGVLVDRMVQLFHRVEQRFDHQVDQFVTRMQATLTHAQQHVEQRQHRLASAMEQYLELKTHQLAHKADALQSYNPLSILARGYGVISTEAGVPVTSIQQLSPQQRVTLQLTDGQAVAQVQSVLPKPK